MDGHFRVVTLTADGLPIGRATICRDHEADQIAKERIRNFPSPHNLVASIQEVTTTERVNLIDIAEYADAQAEA